MCTACTPVRNKTVRILHKLALLVLPCAQLSHGLELGLELFLLRQQAVEQPQQVQLEVGAFAVEAVDQAGYVIDIQAVVVVLLVVARAFAAHNLQLEVADALRAADIAVTVAAAPVVGTAVVIVVAVVVIVRIVVPIVHNYYLDSVVVASHIAVRNYRSAFVAVVQVVVGVVGAAGAEPDIAAVGPPAARNVEAQADVVEKNYHSAFVVDLNNFAVADFGEESVAEHSLAQLGVAESVDVVRAVGLAEAEGFVLIVLAERAAHIDWFAHNFAELVAPDN